MTERMRDQQRLAGAEAALHQAQKMEAVGQLTGGLAHDFNNLLQALSGNIELIRRKPADTQHVLKWAERSAGVLTRGARLTSQLLTFSREQAPKLRSVAVRNLIEGMHDLLRSTLGSSVRLTLALPQAEVFAVADSTQLEMAVLNLVINARDAVAGGGGGEVVIRVEAIRLDDDLQLPSGDYACLSVSDNGGGMDAQIAQRAFDPFFTTKGVGKGSGLGLSQVYGMAQRAGGSARIDSRPDDGTTVTVWLRCGAESFEHAPGSDFGSLGATPTTAVTVLVIDDDNDVRQLLAEALQALGHTVLQAADGITGINALARDHVDAIVVDFAMPGMNGAEFARLARQSVPGLPVLVVSGHADSAALEAAVGTDVALLRKPFELATLQAAFAKLMQDTAGSEP
ncbi:MAG: ATP-binding protein [Burkholderiales bacterium]